MKNGEIFYIDFKGNRGSEINNILLNNSYANILMVKNYIYYS